MPLSKLNGFVNRRCFGFAGAAEGHAQALEAGFAVMEACARFEDEHAAAARGKFCRGGKARGARADDEDICVCLGHFASALESQR